MPSHTDSDPTKKDLAPEWRQDWCVKGNNEADALAAAAADLHAVLETEANKIIEVYKDLELIQDRHRSKKNVPTKGFITILSWAI